ncbi:class I ribonucleotide reductase maintenance protein YfaE [Celerinatantimonas sp. YJH-8]|uniref:class I ribonucleotide reductase maintenance protein YfaE n=1 Tax=Celerinatantimonas sp. YJH-8 TaxID=3228714 RepID=UPI0038C4A1DA
MSRLRINNQSVPIQENETLLEAAEQAGFTPDYQCRNGFCGTCRAKLERGHVSYHSQPLACCDEDEVLLCCAYLDPSDSAEFKLNQG